MPVSRLIHHAHRVLSMPPHVVLQKVIGRVRRHCRDRAHRQGDFQRPTYLGEEPFHSQRLIRYLDGLSGAPWSFSRSLLASLLENYCRHRFDLLGSGWTVVRHGIECKGMEGHRYYPGVTIESETQGHWLEAYINTANLEESRRIWRLIQAGYEPIDWQLDFKSGFRWSEAHWYKQIPLVHTGHKPGVDIKVPWELARMQHLPLLAYGFSAASQAAPGFDSPHVYASEFRHQILDFISTNPPRFGVNWACTMDVAIRVANWLVTYDLFHAVGAHFDADFERELLRSVYQHGSHIIANLEWNNEAVGNHYLADIVGLLFAAAYLPRSAETDVWLAFSVQELVKEVGQQFTPDGANFEASTSYHRLCAEMVVYATALVLGLDSEKRRALIKYDHTLHRVQPPLNPSPVTLYPWPGQQYDCPFPEWYFERLRLMAQFSEEIARPDERITQVGDCDNGRFLKLHPSYRTHGSALEEDQLNHSHLVAAIRSLLNTPDVPIGDNEPVDSHVVRRLAAGTRYAPEQDRVSSRTSLEVGEPPELTASIAGDYREGLRRAAYPHFGLFIYKSSRLYLAIRCGRGDLNKIGNHAHNDNLSFELALDGNPIITDPGTYVYTPLLNMRNRFRSTAMHNTLMIAGREQNGWREGREGLFALKDRSNPKVRACESTFFSGEHFGFGVPHRRELWIRENGIQGRDHCELEGVKTILFHLPPSCKVSGGRDASSVELTSGGHTYRLSSVDGELSIADSYHSDGYGSLAHTHVVSLKTMLDTVEWIVQG
jgi:heparinase II/III-like protein